MSDHKRRVIALEQMGRRSQKAPVFVIVDRHADGTMTMDGKSITEAEIPQGPNMRVIEVVSVPSKYQDGQSSE